MTWHPERKCGDCDHKVLIVVEEAGYGGQRHAVMVCRANDFRRPSLCADERREGKCGPGAELWKEKP